VDAPGSARQALPIGVLPDLDEDLAHGGLHPAVGSIVTSVLVVARSDDVVDIDLALADLGFDLDDQATDVGWQIDRTRHSLVLLCGPRSYASASLCFMHGPPSCRSAAVCPE
jgi:hypothetical protein